MTVLPHPLDTKPSIRETKSRMEIFQALYGTMHRGKFMGLVNGMLSLKLSSSDSAKAIVEKLTSKKQIGIRKVAELLELEELRDACKRLDAPLSKQKRENFLDHLEMLNGREFPAPSKPPREVRSKKTSAPGRTKSSDPGSSSGVANEAANPQKTPANQRALVRDTNTALLKKFLRARDKNGANMADLKAEFPSLSQKVIRTMLHKFLKEDSVRWKGKTLGRRWTWVPRKTLVGVRLKGLKSP
ncbi:MAG: hypothetical protein IPK50_13850 [Fibrobacterota bacterium]|nr:MAG: hypothetical protein IPK50_13850 [Fibrobacterota bacterium]